MAEAMTDDTLQQLVDSWKRKRLEFSHADSQREMAGRVYVNRSVSMDQIKYIGFDMDYTLVVYKSPAYEQLSYQMTMERLVAIGYPQELVQVQYDPTFPLRGLLFDKKFGNLLKVDQFGNILSCFHGFNSLTSMKIRKFYPNKYIQPTVDRIYILNTLFHMPEIFILALMVDYFDNNPSYVRLTGGEGEPAMAEGVRCGDVFISYKMVWQDVRSAVDWTHNQGDLKEKTLADLDKYVVKNPQLPLFLHKMRKSGRKTFIATNSGFAYTQRVMTYMFDFPYGYEPGTPHADWKTYFDYIIVDAKKPLFFEEGTMLREVDEHTAALKLGVFTGVLKPGKVYSGGSSAAFCKYTGTHGKEILYVGDHIFGDVIKAKKQEAWRTFLVLPELTNEVQVWDSNKGLFLRLQNLEYILTEMYRGSGLNTENLPDLPSMRKAIKITAQEMENGYPSQLGSLLRCGSRLTHFAFQASRFADLYSSRMDNLMNYPDLFLFSAPHQLMAHETPPSEGLPLSPTPDLSEKRRHEPHHSHLYPLVKTLSIIDHDMDEEDGRGQALNTRQSPRHMSALN